jgi:chitinase
MAHDIIVPTPEDICDAKGRGATVLLSIGGLVNLKSKAVTDTFIATVVPILKKYHFDGIDIAIKAGLVTSGSMTWLSASQRNLIRIIDTIFVQMGREFGLTLAPEAVNVLGATLRYQEAWGAYLLIIKKYIETEQLWWLSLQYYNGVLYGCKNDTYDSGDVRGFIATTDCLAKGYTRDKVTVRVPYQLMVPGLPAQLGSATGYMSTDMIKTLWSQYGGDIKGFMAWSINWDASLGWTFGDDVKRIIRADIGGKPMPDGVQGT